MRSASPSCLWVTPASTKPTTKGSTAFSTKISSVAATMATSLVEVNPRAARYSLAFCGSCAT
eukprot:2910393-Heterocapsa_arctica.AAC.1